TVDEELQNLLQQAESLLEELEAVTAKESEYTATSYSALVAKITQLEQEVNKGESANKSSLTSLMEAVEEAQEALKSKALSDALAKENLYSAEEYTEDTYQAFAAAIEAGKEAMAGTDNLEEQKTKAAAIEDAISKLEPKSNPEPEEPGKDEELEVLLQQAAALLEEVEALESKVAEYTTESYNVLDGKATELEQEVIKGQEAGRDILTALMGEVRTAKDNLKSKALSDALAKETLYSAEEYTEDTYQAFTAAIAAGKEAMAGANNLEEQKSKAAAIEDAISKLERKTTPEPEDPVLPESKAIRVAPIEDLVYTGKALKPAVQVYDGEKLLQLNKDYKVTYKNNVNANVGAVQAGEEFNENLPYVIITGKGNYSGTLQVNFNILPIEIRDEKDVIDSRLKVNIAEQLVVNTKKAVAPLKSVSFGKTLKEGQDYTLKLFVMNATDSQGLPLEGYLDDYKVPAGAKGNFSMTIKFEGNYHGAVTYLVSVAEKTELIKNAAITLKKEFKSIDIEAFNNEYTNKMMAEAVEVKMGRTLLVNGTDYMISFADTQIKVGTTSFVVKGMGNYKGTKTVTFKLTGKALAASKLTFENFGNLTFTGEALTQ
ncbi:MAG: hypothetical protein IKW28_05910, partial [Lachnospiraceae bacterium]|nr:hypothetical protein [Lachnospiraceae bacterium]